MPRALKSIRKKKGYTLRELASMSGVGTSTIGNFENGKTEMSVEFLKKISSVLGVTPDELLEDEQDGQLNAQNFRDEVHQHTLKEHVPDVVHESQPTYPVYKKTEPQAHDYRTIEDRLEAIERNQRSIEANQQQILSMLFRMERRDSTPIRNGMGELVSLGHEETPKTTYPQDSLKFPALCLGSVAAGAPSQHEEQSTVLIDYRMPTDHYLLQVNGESMEPTIPNGSLIEVMEHKVGWPAKGSVVVYADATGASLKVLHTTKDEEGNRVGQLHSINPEFPDVEPIEDGVVQAVFVRIVR